MTIGSGGSPGPGGDPFKNVLGKIEQGTNEPGMLHKNKEGNKDKVTEISLRAFAETQIPGAESSHAVTSHQDASTSHVDDVARGSLNRRHSV